MTEPAAVRDAFEREYGREARLFRAPGRVNLIGEHTDYNDGFVLPMALERCTLVAAAARPDRLVRVFSRDHGARGAFDLDERHGGRRGDWLDYVEGMARVLEERTGALTGADLLVTGDVPEGAGLSSSAALETAVGLGLLALTGRTLERRELALCGQAAEHRFVGTMCGIMDQLASLFGQAGHALLIDCRSLEIRPIPVDPARATVLVCDSGVRHRHSGGEYNQRRAQCAEALRLLASELPGARALRDVLPADFERLAPGLPEPVRRRARHVVAEIDRTSRAATALAAADLCTFGRLMYDSHRSLRDDYEVSVPELDALVEAAQRAPGVLGARMTGGGFGGCVVALAEPDSIEVAAAAISESFARRFGRAPAWFSTGAAEGAGEVVTAG